MKTKIGEYKEGIYAVMVNFDTTAKLILRLLLFKLYKKEPCEKTPNITFSCSLQIPKAESFSGWKFARFEFFTKIA